VNEEQRRQRDARVAELAEAAVESSEVGGNLTRSEIEDLEVQVRMRINLALDEQAQEIAAAIESRVQWLRENRQTRTAEGCSDAGYIAAGFGDDR